MIIIICICIYPLRGSEATAIAIQIVVQTDKKSNWVLQRYFYGVISFDDTTFAIRSEHCLGIIEFCNTTGGEGID